MTDNRAEQWEEFFEQGKRESRLERKIRSTKDRSKFKETDLRQRAKREVAYRGKAPLGRVTSITAQGAQVAGDEETFLCVIRGVLKKEQRRLKNLIAVGDFVRYEKTATGEGVILHVEPRHSVLSRAETLEQQKEQLIAANIDQVLITVSCVEPPLKPFLVDRYIIAARKGNMEPIIVINKADLLDKNLDEKALADEFVQAYSSAGIQVLLVSANSEKSLEPLREVMRDRSSVFSGQSGVGKSSLINAMTGLELLTGEVVERTKKGSHTTTTAHLVPLKWGGWCIDTPGIKSFGLWDLHLEEVREHYPEFQEVAKQCKFQNCTHLHETKCAVKEAVDEGTIAPLRYASYEWLMQTLDKEHRRR